jgi:very-short-patch-repair endonuclease
MNDWKRFRPAIWLVILGIALALVLNLILGAVFIGSGVGVGIMISRGATRRRWLKSGVKFGTLVAHTSVGALDRDHPSIQIASIAARQHGHITRAQLLAVGISHARIQRWCGQGRLTRVHAGTYALGYRHTEPVAVAMAAVLACGDGAVLSHDSAAALWGWRRWPRVPEVTATGPRRRAGIRAHTTRSLPRADVTRQFGVPVTSPERTIREIESRLTRKQFTRMVKDASLQRRLDDAAVTRLLGYAADPTRSEFEEAFRRFCRRFGLPKAQTLATVHGYEVDALFSAQRLVVELDGWEFHRSRVAFGDDRDRDADLLDFGYETVRITWERLHETPEREAARLTRILARREREIGAVS